MKDWKVKVENPKDFVKGYKKGKQDFLEEVKKMIDEHIKNINEMRVTLIERDFVKPTIKTLEHYHVGEVTKFEILKQQLKKLGEK
jgi:hypothetical protein